MKLLPLFFFMILTACMEQNPISTREWQRTASAPVPLAEFFPNASTMCIQSPYMTWEELDKYDKVSAPFYVIGRDNSQDDSQIIWLFDERREYQTRFRVSRVGAVDLSDNPQACYPVKNQCFVTTEMKETELSNRQRVRYPVVMVQACTR